MVLHDERAVLLPNDLLREASFSVASSASPSTEAILLARLINIRDLQYKRCFSPVHRLLEATFVECLPERIRATFVSSESDKAGTALVMVSKALATVRVV